MTNEASLARNAVGLTEDNSAPPHAAKTTSDIVRPLLIAVISLTLVAHAYFVFRQNVNWDEFYYLSLIYDYTRGALAYPMQSFHVHLFGWLQYADGYEVEQIVAARTTYFFLLLGTCVCVYKLARRMASMNGALFAVLCCVGYSNILYHGTSFRADGLAIFLLLLGMVLVQFRARRFLALVVGAGLVAVAFLITIKSVFFLPTLTLLLTGSWRSEQSTRTRAAEALLFGGVLLGTGLALHLWHRSTPGMSVALDSVAYLQSSADKVVLRGMLFPGVRYFVGTVLGNIAQWACLAYAAWSLGRTIFTRQQSLQTLSMFGLVLPLFCLAFYRNAFPYFYVMLMPPALVLCGLTFDELSRRSAKANGHALAIVTALTIAGTVAGNTLIRAADGTAMQREVIRAVHDMFPQPVPYIDRNGMVSSFPKVGFFMSTWGLEDYRRAKRPVFAALLRTERPQLLIVNSPALSSVFSVGPKSPREGQLLLDEDAVVLREHFVQLWGPIYVLGKRISLKEAVETQWEVPVEGSYDLISEGPVTIGYTVYEPGSRVALSAHAVPIRSELPQDITLHISIAGGIPSHSAPTGPLYIDF